jgi:hypothetical protein
MSAFDIPPHSRRASRLALSLLALLAVSSFATGLLRQPDVAAPPPPPLTDAAGGAIAEARPIAATALQLAPAPRFHRAPAVEPDQPADTPPIADAVEASAPAAVDAAAVAPETQPSPPKPVPEPQDPPG